MTPQLETVLGCAATITAGCAVLVTWAVVKTARTPGTWTDATNKLGARITVETNERLALDQRVTRLEDLQRHQTGTGPRLGVPPVRRIR